MARRNFGAPSPREVDDRMLNLSGKDKHKIRILQPFVEEWRQYTLRANNEDESDIVKFVIARPGDMLSKKGFRTTRRFAVNVWDYDSGSVKILVGGKQIFDEFDAWRENGIDVMASDAMITKTGANRNTQYSVVRLDTTPFEHEIANDAFHDLSTFDNPPSEEALLKILKELNIDYNNILLPTYTVAEAAATVMPFGKFKGRTLEDILNDDPEYIEWFTSSSEDQGRIGDDIYIALKILVTNGEYDPNVGTFFDPENADTPADDTPDVTTDAAPAASEVTEVATKVETPVEASVTTDTAKETPAEVPEDVVKSPVAFKKWLASENLAGLTSIEKDDSGGWTLELDDESFFVGDSRKDVLTKTYLSLVKNQQAPVDPAPVAPATATPDGEAVVADGMELSDDELRAKIKAIFAANSGKWADFREVLELFERHTNPAKHDLDKLDRSELIAMFTEVNEA